VEDANLSWTSLGHRIEIVTHAILGEELDDVGLGSVALVVS